MMRSFSGSSFSSQISSTASSSSIASAYEWILLESVQDEYQLADFIDNLPLSYSMQTNSHLFCAVCDQKDHKMKQQYRDCGVSGVSFDVNNAPIVGDGSKIDPVYLFMTTLKLLRNADTSSQKHESLFHIDDTYKTNKNNFILRPE